MFSTADRPERMILLGLPTLIILVGTAASMIGHRAVVEIADVLTAWTLASVPLAILVGHCSMGES